MIKQGATHEHGAESGGIFLLTAHC